MKDIVKFGSRIAIFAGLSALILAGIFTIANPLIEAAKAREVKAALKEVLPDADSFKRIDNKEDQTYYYLGLGSKNAIEGYILPAAGKGYSSIIDMLIAINKQKKILGLKIISQQETPGLGTRIVEIKEGEDQPWFQMQFIGKTLAEARLKKNGGQIDAITGATISSKAVVDGIQNKLSSFKIPKE